MPAGWTIPKLGGMGNNLAHVEGPQRRLLWQKVTQTGNKCEEEHDVGMYPFSCDSFARVPRDIFLAKNNVTNCVYRPLLGSLRGIIRVREN